MSAWRVLTGTGLFGRFRHSQFWATPSSGERSSSRWRDEGAWCGLNPWLSRMARRTQFGGDEPVREQWRTALNRVGDGPVGGFKHLRRGHQQQPVAPSWGAERPSRTFSIPHRNASTADLHHCDPLTGHRRQHLRARKEHSAPRVPCRRILHDRPDGPMGWGWISLPGAGQPVDREVGEPISSSFRGGVRSRGAARTRYGSNGALCRPDCDGRLCAAEPPEDARLDRHRRHDRALRAQRHKRRPCGRLREVRTEPGVARSRAAADDAEVVPPLPNRADRCDGCSRRDAPRASFRRWGLGCGSARLAPVTARPAKGGGLARTG